MKRSRSDKSLPSKDSDKRAKPDIEYVFRELLINDGHSVVGCAVAIDSDGITGTSGRQRIGVIKFFLPKWNRFFIHLFSPEEGITEFATLPKALKYVKSCNSHDDEIKVDFSRLCKDRFWVGPSDLPPFQLLSDKPVWSRPFPIRRSTADSMTWKQCAECKYLIDDDEPCTGCGYCPKVFHSDCLHAYEKLPTPEYDTGLLDEQGKRYESASKKWKTRKTVKNPSLVVDNDEVEDVLCGSKIIEASSEFMTCLDCRNCRYCCTRLLDEVISSIPNPPSIQPYVVCIKCNSGFHGHCGFPQVPKLHSSVEWQCDDCRECNSCGRVTYLNESTGQPSLLTDWALPSFDQCKQCFAGLDKGEYCPVCMKAWTIEWGGDMVQCDSCEFWVHTSCESDLKSINVSKLGSSDVKYNCPICRDTTDIHRRRRVIDLLRAIDKIALFSEPVSQSFLPVYLKVIKNPMDLAKMRQRNESPRGYESNIEFVADFELIVENAKIFNMPNSPAFRLAEQFHKQGKLLIEKYLLCDRKGASMIEGLPDNTNESPDSNPDLRDLQASRPSRVASVHATKIWQKPSAIARYGKRQMTYADVVEMIKKSGRQLSIDSSTTAEADSGLISPYRKRKLSVASGAISTTATPSPVAVATQVTPILSEEELQNLLMKIFGLTHSWFLTDRRESSPPTREGGMMIDVASNWKDGSSPSEITLGIRWALFESCSICGSFGEPWNLIFCNNCGESMHYYCAGLLAKPDDVFQHINPLRGGDSLRRKFTCDSCTVCRYCGDYGGDENCALCGIKWHRDCASMALVGSKFSIHRGKQVCPDCVIDQSLNFFKSGTCRECSASIHPGIAAALMSAMGDGELNSSSTARPNSSPIIHCINCGGQWHSRCLKEFSDLTICDIFGIYVCDDCGPPRGWMTDVCDNWTTVLKAYKHSSYREILVDIVFDLLRNFGIAVSSSNGMNELLDIFLSASGASTSSNAADLLAGFKSDDPPKIMDPLARRWIEWVLIHREFITGLGNVTVGDLKRRPPEALNSVKYKRIDDEDLLLVKRLHHVWETLTQGDQVSSHVRQVPQTMTLSIPQSEQIFYGECGANLCQKWLHKFGLNSGYIGPGSGGIPTRPCTVPDWDNRECVLCGQRGDQLVMGLLRAVGQKNLWIHSECLYWSLGVSTGLNGWIADVPVPYVTSLDSSPRHGHAGGESDTTIHAGINVLPRICCVCEKNGATVYCQQCQVSVYHFPCAVAANTGEGNRRVLMDTQCRLLTCGRCLYRLNLDKIFQAEFDYRKSKIRPGESISGTLLTSRRYGPWKGLSSLVGELGSGNSGSASGEIQSVYRKGSLTILNRGKFRDDFHYDGSRTGMESALCGFASIRIFHSSDIPSFENETSTLEITRDIDKRVVCADRRVAYLNTVSEDGEIWTIKVIGGRTVAVGSSLDECFAEFCHVIGRQWVTDVMSSTSDVHMSTSGDARSSLVGGITSGAWFFGLSCPLMSDHVNSLLIGSIKKIASSKRESWMYNPQLRQCVVKILGIEGGLKPVASWRRHLGEWTGGQEIDQLKSLGKLALSSGDESSELLDPNMVIVEWVKSSGEETIKSSRLKSAAVAAAVTGVEKSDSVALNGGAGKYKSRIAIADSELLVVQRSRIHNYGLFAKNGFLKGEYVVEYQGEVLRETIADEREKRAERAGNGDGGSCYMFRLDEDYVVDATVKGNCARFINHSCNPNCTCKMVEDENKRKHIMIIAKRDISPGEEITYDYQFAVESEKLACLCGAPNCLGRLN